MLIIAVNQLDIREISLCEVIHLLILLVDQLNIREAS
jgi:hypothetical protein